MRYASKIASTVSEERIGRRNSSACAAFISSMASTRSLFCTTFHSFVAAFEPILTWSSCPCDDGMESHEAGQQSPFDWLTMEAAVYCGIMNPLLSPGLATRKCGRLRTPDIILYIRRSEIFASSATAMARKSIARAMGCPWKLPADITSSVSGNTVGLSVAEFISVSSTLQTYAMVSFEAPCTCGIQRKE